MAEKLKRDNATLAEAIKRLRSEAEEVARREGEAAEQVKSSVQVAEALRMEKTELEYEVRKTNTGFSSQIGTRLRDWAVGKAWGSCYSWAALSSHDSKTL